MSRLLARALAVSRRRLRGRATRRLVALLAVPTLLLGCDTSGATPPDDANEDAGPPAGEGDAAPTDGAEPLPQPEDGVVRALGIVLPLPEGWVLDSSLYDDGIIGANPNWVEPDQLVIAAAGIEDTATFGVEGMDLDDALEHFRELLPGEPDQDEEVAVDGAERAHLLRFDDLELEPGAEPSHEIVLLADDGTGHLALFNYAATESGLDEEVIALIVDGAGLDPDSEPVEIEDPATTS